MYSTHDLIKLAIAVWQIRIWKVQHSLLFAESIAISNRSQFQKK
jgi:hypothetical protein